MVVRASDSLWMFSTALCAVVGVMVVVGVAYQIHLDRVSKRKKLEFQSMKADRGRHPLLVTHHHCWVHFKIRYRELRVSPIGQLYSSIFQQQSLLKSVLSGSHVSPPLAHAVKNRREDFWYSCPLYPIRTPNEAVLSAPGCAESRILMHIHVVM